jgi:hypothetical protein
MCYKDIFFKRKRKKTTSDWNKISIDIKFSCSYIRIDDQLISKVQKTNSRMFGYNLCKFTTDFVDIANISFPNWITQHGDDWYETIDLVVPSFVICKKRELLWSATIHSLELIKQNRNASFLL